MLEPWRSIYEIEFGARREELAKGMKRLIIRVGWTSSKCWWCAAMAPLFGASYGHWVDCLLIYREHFFAENIHSSYEEGSSSSGQRLWKIFWKAKFFFCAVKKIYFYNFTRQLRKRRTTWNLPPGADQQIETLRKWYPGLSIPSSSSGSLGLV